MKRFYNLRTKYKLVLTFGTMGLLMLAIGAVALFGMRQLSERNEAIYSQNLVPTAIVGELRVELQQIVTFIAWHILAQDQAAAAKQAENIATADEQIARLVQAYGPTLASEEDKQYFERFTATWAEYRAAREKVLTLSAGGNKTAAEEHRKTALVPKLAILRSTLEQLLKENDRLAKDNFVTGEQLSQRLLTTLGLLGLVAVVLGLVGSWMVTGFFTQGLGNMVEATKQLRSGNLAYRSSVSTQEEIGQLAEAFNQLAADLANTMDEMNARIEIMNQTSIVSEANLKGDILSVNEKYLQVSKYTREELMGAPHSITRHPDMPKAVFKEMWATIGRGQIFRGVVKNRAKDGTPYYVDAVIKPVMGPNGKPRKYLGVRYDITESEIARQTMKGMLDAIDKSYATIEFKLDGTILTANDNFLKTLGYRLEEIQGQHHRMFCDPAYVNSGEYAAFWQRLNHGEFEAAVYRRIGKGGKEVWIQASYNPVKDEVGRPFKVVKFATDVTAQRVAMLEVEKLISSAAAGQLSERIRTDRFAGDVRAQADSVNRLLDAITQPVHEAQEVLAALAMNDLTKEMTGTYQGELDAMKTSINAVVRNMSHTLFAVREAVESVLVGSEQITKGNEDLSQRTSEQAGSLEETSASMEEMTSTVKQNADNAKQANQLAIAARETADKGGAVTRKAVEAMGEINKSSKKIADIITVIDEIAFQTNLLALNAAVEAARAGEHGRGFAVVAAEVRNLAQRSASAAKEIKGLINESIQRVTDGSELVDQSGKTLGEIVSSVKHVTDIISEITAASQEQASGIDQVNQAIMSMDDSTQKNAALVEETTSASQSLQIQAKALQQRVLAFKLAATEVEKAAMPPVDELRRSVAHTIHEAYGRTGEPSAKEHKPVPTARVGGPHRQTVHGHHRQKTMVGSAKTADVSSGGGREGGHEFEEF